MMPPSHPASDSDRPPSDPRPQPPAEPALEDCCRSGCNPCVFDLYEQALERYEQALAAWRARHPAAP
jgi:hypothetical protein